MMEGERVPLLLVSIAIAISKQTDQRPASVSCLGAPTALHGIIWHTAAWHPGQESQLTQKPIEELTK